MQVRKVPEALVEIEAVADEQLVRHGEADVAHGEIVNQAPVRAVEERRSSERPWLAQAQRLAEVVECETRVDDVLDDDHVAARDLGVEVLEEADPRVAAGFRAAVPGELEKVEPVMDRDRPREIGAEDRAGLQRGDEQRLAVGVVVADLRAELGDAVGDRPGRQVDLADAVGAQEARSSPYRSAWR